VSARCLRASVTFSQEVWRADTLLTQGMVRIGWVQPVTPRDASVAQAGDEASGEDSFRPVRIPARILAILPTPISASKG